MIPSTRLRRAVLLSLTAAALAAPPARADMDAALARVAALENTDPRQAMAELDRLAAEAQRRGAAADIDAVRRARCWLLSYTEPDKALALVATTVPHAGPALRICRGYALEQLKRFDEAMAEYEAGIDQARRLDDRKALARGLALRGEQRYVGGLYADAIADLKASYDLERRLGNESNQRYVLNALANLYADRNIRDYDNALACYRQLLDAHERSGNRQAMATTHFNLGATFENKGDLERARRHFATALQIDLERGAADEVAVNQRAYAVVLSKLGMHASALALLDAAAAHAARRSPPDPDLVAAIRLSRGGAHRRAGHYAQALADLDAARRHFEAPRNERYLQKIFEEIAEAHRATGNWKAAYAAQAERMATQEALAAQTLDERSTRLRVQFHAEQARLKNAELQHQNQVQQLELDRNRQVRRWQLAALAAAGVVIALLCAFGVRQRRLGIRMRELAMTDELTRLPNRRSLMAFAAGALEEAQSTGTPLSVAGMDIDYFKKINDRFGHAVGDVVLQRVAHALRMALRPGDAIGRTGGEEFVAVLRGARGGDAIGAAERLRLAVAGIDCADLPAGLVPAISIGVAEYRPGVDTLELLLQRADGALYRAKEGGRNRVEAAAA